jgi:outer membrane protein assembly factor BamA
LASDYIILSKIGINGNQKTKTSIITRELDIAEGDTIMLNELENVLLKNKNKIINLNLFLNVNLNIIHCEAPFAELQIYVAEQFFLLPVPIFRLADRSFNEWWYNRNHDFKRIIYGINFVHFNVGGRAEEFMINLENGFTRQIALVYKKPYINSAMKTGLDFSLIYNTNKQIPYRTFEDKLVFAKNDEQILLNKFATKIVLRRRNNFYERQRLELSFNKETLSDSVSALNPNYFLNSATKLKYFKASYIFEGDHRNNIIFPTKGHYFIGKISRLGILKSDNVSQNELYLSYAYYMKLGKKWIGDFNFRTKITGPTLQPFATSTAIGYKTDNIRGYDLYVIDGQKLGIYKSNLRYNFFDQNVKIPAIGKLKQAQILPLAIYGRVFYDAGYVWNKNYLLNNSLLANKLISGFGIGLDIVSIYSGALKISYSFNNLRERGLYFAYGKDF